MLNILKKTSSVLCDGFGSMWTITISEFIVSFWLTLQSMSFPPGVVASDHLNLAFTIWVHLFFRLNGFLALLLSANGTLKVPPDHLNWGRCKDHSKVTFSYRNNTYRAQTITPTLEALIAVSEPCNLVTTICFHKQPRRGNWIAGADWPRGDLDPEGSSQIIWGFFGMLKGGSRYDCCCFSLLTADTE